MSDTQTPATTAQHCPSCEAPNSIRKVHAPVTYHVEGIPFSTKRPYHHHVCISCREEFISPEDTPKVQREMTDGVTALRMEDSQNRTNESVPFTSVFCPHCKKLNIFDNPKKGSQDCKYCRIPFSHMIEHKAPEPASRYFNVHVKYLTFDYKTRYSDTFQVYGREQDVAGIAIRQFSLPPDAVKVVGVKYYV
jgi:hypothetical protein